MHQSNIKIYQHLHDFHEVKESNFKKLLIVIIITTITMFAEIIFGIIFNSMALLSDGWHMATHGSALSITFFTYFIAKKYKNDTGYAFGTWKVEILGAYTSAILLGVIGIYVIYSSIERIFHPLLIQYNQALIVAILGLLVNIVCAIILNLGEQNHHQSIHEHEHKNNHNHDLNMQSAYLHVIADALTSVFAIIALLGAKLFQLNSLDPLMGILSSILIFRWSFQLLRDTSSILLDRDKNDLLQKEIRDIIESDSDTKISDLHLWKVGQNSYSCIISLVAKKPKELNVYKDLLREVHELSHISIEIINCKQ
ncbi:MAG: CDF family Co(II)/Ni(II) efflux transporter DmeF [Elusimicrobia bacterium]|nr:CDF family Co(II)/Ni(II) efflux transporter DmeF [Elusimicrobiota bacterium]